MARETLFVKKLTKTDIRKRLSVPTVKKTCFLKFGRQHKVEFTVIDKNNIEWRFGCSIRKKNDYPKPVLSKGWLQFVRCWELAIGDEVIVYRITDKAGKGYNRIEVIRREVSPLVWNHEADQAKAVVSYADVEDEGTITSDSIDRAMTVASYTDTDSTDQAVSYDETEGIHNQPGLMMFEFISLKPDIAVSEPKVINFFELSSQEQREMEYSNILTLHNINIDESPVTSSTAPYFEFL